MLWRGASPAGSNCYCFGGGVCTAPTGFLSGLTRLALAHHGIDSLGSSIQDRVYSVRAPPPFLPQLGRCCQGHNVREYASLSLLYLAHRLAHAPILRLVKKISKQNRDGRVVGIVGIAGGVARCARLAPEGEGEQGGAGGGGGGRRGARVYRDGRPYTERDGRPYTERGARPYTQRRAAVYRERRAAVYTEARAELYIYAHTHTHNTLSLSLSRCSCLRLRLRRPRNASPPSLSPARPVARCAALFSPKDNALSTRKTGSNTLSQEQRR